MAVKLSCHHAVNHCGVLKVPMEYNHLQEIPIMALRNRLLLLHHISELFCPCIPMFDLEGRLGQTGHGPSVGFDTLRGILISQGKVRQHELLILENLMLYVCSALKQYLYFSGTGSSFQEGGSSHDGEGPTARTCGGAQQDTGTGGNGTHFFKSARSVLFHNRLLQVSHPLLL